MTRSAPIASQLSRGQSTHIRSGCFMRPACASACSPQPQKRSTRTGPVIAAPVSWAITSRRSGVVDKGSVVSSQTGVPYGTLPLSTATERPG